MSIFFLPPLFGVQLESTYDSLMVRLLDLTGQRTVSQHSLQLWQQVFFSLLLPLPSSFPSQSIRLVACLRHPAIKLTHCTRYLSAYSSNPRFKPDGAIPPANEGKIKGCINALYSVFVDTLGQASKQPTERKYTGPVVAEGHYISISASRKG